MKQEAISLDGVLLSLCGPHHKLDLNLDPLDFYTKVHRGGSGKKIKLESVQTSPYNSPKLNHPHVL